MNNREKCKDELIETIKKDDVLRSLGLNEKAYTWKYCELVEDLEGK